MVERGKFITFEGGELVGKTTQVQLLVNFFRKLGIRVEASREPGGVYTAEKIRQIIMEDKAGPLAQVFLFNAARVEFIKNFLQPTLNSGTTVISDRFADSTIVYQGIVQRVPLEQVMFIVKAAIEDL